MNPIEPIDPQYPEIEIPSRLTADLQTLGGHRPPVPPALDASILAAARLQLGRRARPGRTARVLRWAVPAAAAAAVLLVLLARQDFSPMPESRTASVRQPSTVNRNQSFDLDHSGRIDILDAFTLARRLERGEATDPAWDRTGDGAVDRKDVDAIAMAAVKVAE